VIECAAGSFVIFVCLSVCVCECGCVMRLGQIGAGLGK